MNNLVDFAQNQDLTHIGVKLGDWLAKDVAIKEYCQKHFDRNALIRVAAQEKQFPMEDDAPYIVLHDLAKSEGVNNTKPSYQCVFCIGVSAEDEYATTDTGVEVANGLQRTSEFMTLIQDALNRYNCRPPSQVEQNIPGLVNNSPTHWEGFLVAVWEIEIPLGYPQKF